MIKTVLSALVTLGTFAAQAGDAFAYNQYSIKATESTSIDDDGTIVDIKFCANYNIYTDQSDSVWSLIDCENPFNQNGNGKPVADITVSPQGDRSQARKVIIDDVVIKLAGSRDMMNQKLLLIGESEKAQIVVRLTHSIDNETGEDKFGDTLVQFSDRTQIPTKRILSLDPEIKAKTISEDDMLDTVRTRSVLGGGASGG